MRLTLAGFDQDTLRPLSPAQIARREQITAEMQRIAATRADIAAKREALAIARMAASGAVQATASWTPWDWLRWAMPGAVLVLVPGPILLLALEYLSPWSR